MAREYQLISADSHVLEPPHIWTTYMAKQFHDKVPRVVSDGDGGEAWQFAPGIPECCCTGRDRWSGSSRPAAPRLV